MHADEKAVRAGRSLRYSLMLLIGIPMLVGLSVQGVLAVKSGDAYEGALEQVSRQEPLAAAPLRANITAQQEMGKIMGPASGVALLLGLGVAFVVARIMARRFAHLDQATQRIAEGHLAEEIPRLRDVEWDPLVDDLNAMQRKLRERLELEIEKAELAKALELGAEVQRMFLPASTELGHARLRAGAAYRPATICGGDFWHAHVDADGRLLLFVGDVTGHGSASAVVTAAVSAQIRMQLARSERPEVAALLSRLNESVLDLCAGSYRMTMSVIEVSADGTALRFHGAGAPPLVLRDADGAMDTLTVAGAPLGTAKFSTGLSQRALTRGTRIHVFTDGIIEAERGDGRAFGLRRLSRALGNLSAVPVARLSEALLAEVDQYASGAHQDDDWTMVALEVA